MFNIICIIELDFLRFVGMACAFPLTAWKIVGMAGPRFGEILWKKPLNVPTGSRIEEVKIPCGQCMLCRISQARSWAVRMEHEASLHKHVYFLTLTYSEEYVPKTADGLLTLRYVDVQGFLKRFRDRISPLKIRFYCAGEYGDQTHRPHYHMIVFGYDFPDKEVIKLAPGQKQLTWLSPIVSECWPFGHHLLAPVSFDAMCYVAGYVQKKFKGQKHEMEVYYRGREPERAVMSRRPGIGHDWIIKYEKDVYPSDEVITSKGFKLKPPKYYDNLIFGKDLDHYELGKNIKSDRQRAAADSGIDQERLRIRNESAKRRLRERQLTKSFSKKRVGKI